MSILFVPQATYIPGMIRVILQIEVGELIRLVDVELGQRADHLLVGDELRWHCAYIGLDKLLGGDAAHLKNGGNNRGTFG